MDALEELIQAYVSSNDIERVKQNNKKDEMSKELRKINLLEKQVEGEMKLSSQEEDWHKLINKYREMTQNHQDMHEEKDTEIKRLPREVEVLTFLSKTHKGKVKQQQKDCKMKVKRCKEDKKMRNYCKQYSLV